MEHAVKESIKVTTNTHWQIYFTLCSFIFFLISERFNRNTNQWNLGVFNNFLLRFHQFFLFLMRQNLRFLMLIRLFAHNPNKDP